MKDERTEILSDWARRLVNAAHSGQLTNGKPVQIRKVEIVRGPRAGAVELHAGVNAGRLLRALSADDCALARQFIPFAFAGEPAVYMAGRYVRCEAGWPPNLAETLIPLTDLGAYPKNHGRWIAGKNELGQTVTLGLNDRTPHFLFAGATGSGKSVALRSAVLQLSRDPDNYLVPIDGKWGEGLGPLARLPRVVGPLATDIPTARAALGWAVQAMKQRYRQPGTPGRVIVVVDEFQEFTNDELITECLRRLVAQGRAANVHCLLATQHPTLASFGDPGIRRNLVGRVALRVMDYDASRVAVGGAQPRADHLLGAGDAYAIAPTGLHRAQLAYVDNRDFDRAERTDPLLEDWPEFEAEDLGQEPKVNWSYTGAELGVALVSAVKGEGRPALMKRLEAHGLGRPGSERAARLLNIGREQRDWLRENADLLID